MRRREFFAAAAGVALTRMAHAGTGPVVLELFTSQGCSDCPPADRLMGLWARQPNVIGLSWHVDYWDSGSWRDPFSSRLSTARQRAYAQALATEVYTPALVVNGNTMLVGSNRLGAEQAMAAARTLPVTMRVGGGMVSVAAAPGPVTLLFASMDPEQETPVRGGENSGRRLQEFQVVRESMVLAAWDGTARTVALPAVTAGRKAAVLLQTTDLQMVGAAKVA